MITLKLLYGVLQNTLELVRGKEIIQTFNLNQIYSLSFLILLLFVCLSVYFKTLKIVITTLKSSMKL